MIAVSPARRVRRVAPHTRPRLLQGGGGRDVDEAPCLLAVLVFTAADSTAALEKRSIDPMLPGSLDPKPLPPLKNPGAPSTPAKELFARKSTPFPAAPRSETKPSFAALSLTPCDL